MYTKQTFIAALKEGNFWDAYNNAKSLKMEMHQIIDIAQQNKILSMVSGYSECEILWKALSEGEYSKFLRHSKNSQINGDDLREMLISKLEEIEYVDQDSLFDMGEISGILDLWKELGEKVYGSDISKNSMNKASNEDMLNMLESRINYYEYQIDEDAPAGLEVAFKIIGQEISKAYELEYSLRDEVFVSKESLDTDEVGSESGFSESSELSNASTDSSVAPDGDVHSYYAGAIDVGLLNLKTGCIASELPNQDILGIASFQDTELAF